MERTRPLAVLQPRVSSKDQRNEGHSLPAQEKLLRLYCEQKNFQVAHSWSIAETASKPTQRREFHKMMNYIQEHEIKLLIVEKVDRLVRSFVDLVAIDNWLEADSERQVHFVKDGLILHRASRSQEKLNWGIRVLLAKNYIDNLKEEVDKGIREKLANGGLPGKPPPGYRSVGDVGRKELIPDEMGPLVTDMFESYLNPMNSVTSLTHEMTRKGLLTKTGRPIARSYMHRMLSNPIYLGKIPWAGRVYEGHHQPLTDEGTFRAVQIKLHGGSQASPRLQTHDPLFRSRLMCRNCTRTISWELQKGRYYGKCKDRRTCTRRNYLREDQLETILITHMNGLMAPSPEIVEVAIQEARANEIDTEVEARRKRQQLEQRLQDIHRRLALAYDDRLDERITAEQYDRIRDKFEQERKDVQQEIEKPIASLQEAYEHNLNLVNLCLSAGQIYQAADLEQKRILLSEMFSTLALEGNEILWEWTKPVSAIARTVDQDHALHKNFEPDGFSSTKREKALVRASLSTWQGLTSLLRTLREPYSPTAAARVGALLKLRKK